MYHVGVYEGGTNMVDSPHTGARVSYVRLSSLRGRFAGARRLLH